MNAPPMIFYALLFCSLGAQAAPPAIPQDLGWGIDSLEILAVNAEAVRTLPLPRARPVSVAVDCYRLVRTVESGAVSAAGSAPFSVLSAKTSYFTEKSLSMIVGAQMDWSSGDVLKRLWLSGMAVTPQGLSARWQLERTKAPLTLDRMWDLIEDRTQVYAAGREEVHQDRIGGKIFRISVVFAKESRRELCGL